MIIRKEKACDNKAFTEAVSHLGKGEASDRMLFFDIETTGLSASSSYLYLIGCVGIEDGTPVITQLFSEGPADEPLLLAEFTKLLAGCDAVIHFNGQTFDIPYIVRKLGDHKMSDTLSSKESIDIYKLLRPYKRILGTESMKQKALERLAGLERRDIYDGGELIGIYNRYLALARMKKLLASRGKGSPAPILSGQNMLGTNDPDELLDVLLLHNYEDVLGMLTVTGLLSLKELAEGHFTVESSEPAPDNTLKVVLTDVDPSAMKLLNCEASISLSGYDVTLKKRAADNCCALELYIPIFEGELKLFYPNYREYFYLPAEDMAVHSSLSSFLDPSLRKKCTAATCYTRHSGRFYPIPEKAAEHGCKLFRSDYRGTPCFTDAGTEPGRDIIAAYLELFIK